MNIESKQRSQDEFLEMLKRERTPLSVFLVSGIRLSGSIEAFDRYAIFLSGPGGTQYIYKHSISTILPAVPTAAAAPSPEGTRGTKSSPKNDAAIETDC